MAADELADACAASSEMALQKSACGERLAEVQRRLLQFRSELRAEEAETNALCFQLAEERRRSNEWWEWHMARLPEYHKDLESLRQTEAFAKTMQMNKQACIQRLRSQGSDEELAKEELRVARQEFEQSEGEVEHIFCLLQESEAQQQQLARQAILEPHKVNRIHQVQHSAERLREAHDLRSQLELASEEARKTEANAKMARAGLHARCARASEELRDAERHLQFLRELHAREFSALGDFEREKLQLLQIYRQEAVEHERTKCRLQSQSGHLCQGDMYPCSSQQAPKAAALQQSRSPFEGQRCLEGPRRTSTEDLQIQMPTQQRSVRRRPL